MRKINTIIKLFKHPMRIIKALAEKKFFNWLPDKVYLKMIYFCETGKRLNLTNPITYNEKLQWLKLYDRRPEYIKYVDKLEVRNYIKEKIGEKYLIPLIGVYNAIDEINWDELPERFVLKCTHASGYNVICKDKKQLDIEATKKQLKKWMKTNWFWYGREWPYKKVIPRIICEEFISEDGQIPDDYKVMCFDGEPFCIQLHKDRFANHTQDIYDLKGRLLPFNNKLYKRTNIKSINAEKLQEIVELSKIISKGYYHMRVDFYLINEKVYFGEITLFNANGFIEFEPDAYNEIIGDRIKLDLKNKL